MTRTPWHLWLVGILSLLWNAGGAWNYVATKLRIESVVGQMTPEQLAFFDATPAWATTTWAIAVWGAVIGSILLLMRRSLAVVVLQVSFFSMLLTAVQNFIIADVTMSDIMGPAAAVFSLVIVVFALLVIWYAMQQRKNRVLR